MTSGTSVYIFATAFIIVAIGYAVEKISGMRSKKVDDKDKAVATSAEVITIYEKQVAQLKVEIKDQFDKFKKEIKEMGELINTQAGQIGKLEGINVEKDKQLAKYEEIFQGRDPETKVMLAKMDATNTALLELMRSIDSRLQGIEGNQAKVPGATETTIITKQS